ncbi:MAG: flagellar brake domain-containing protein, partial [Calditrichaeota bacterium]|nr:flagellar brake domain-containing protein [Calditrichota bacterium]
MTALTIEEYVLKVVDKPELLQIREQVELRVSAGEDVLIFSVRVEDITQEGIFIDRPIIDRVVFNVTAGERIGIEYRRGMVKYRFSSLVISEGRLGTMPVILIQHPHHIDRIRHKLRRKWLRLNIPTKVVF